MKKNSIPLSVLKILPVIICLFALHCATDLAGGGSEVETKVGLFGKLVDESGITVESALVRAYSTGNTTRPVVGLDSIPVDSTYTDSLGEYLFTNLPSGTYNLEGIYDAVSETLYVLIPGLTFDSALYVGIDTLKAPGTVRGSVLFDATDKSGVLCYIPGTSYLAITDASGNFEIPNVPPGVHSVTCNLGGYSRVTVPNVEVISDSTTVLAPVALVIDPLLNPPAPRGLTAEYDSAHGIVSLRWDSVKVSDLAGYVIYRKDSSMIIPIQISGNQLVTVAAFHDSLFNFMEDTTRLIYDYQVKAQDVNNNLSDSYSDPVNVHAAAPDKPAMPLPVHNATEVEITNTLSWVGISSPDSANIHYTVYFDTTAVPVTRIVSGQSATFAEVTGLTDSTTYHWYVSATNGAAVVNGPIWCFTTNPAPPENNAPNIPSNPFPTDSAADQKVQYIHLAWTGGDPDAGDNVFYKLYLDTVNPPKNMIAERLPSNSYFASGLADGKTYYWCIYATDGKAVTHGPVWHFTTKESPVINNPPHVPSNPTPLDSVTDQSTSLVLSWSGGDPDTIDTVLYDIYLGTSNPPITRIATNLSIPTLIYQNLDIGITYYWYISATDRKKTTTGPIWRFNTAEGTQHQVSKPAAPSGETAGKPNESYLYTASSICNNDHAVEYRFDWGDGDTAAWSASASAIHSWARVGTYNAKVQARCAANNSIISEWSIPLAVTIGVIHAVTTPSKPQGESNGNTGASYLYTTGNVFCNNGHAIEYRFDWADGDTSSWSPAASAIHSWSTAGTYLIKAQARCAVDNSIVTGWSEVLLVGIGFERPMRLRPLRQSVGE